MRRVSIRIWLVVLALQLQACTTLQQGASPATATPADQQQAIAALAALPELQEVDVLVRLDNGRLRQNMLEVLEQQAVLTDSPVSGRMDIHFGHQSIVLEAGISLPGPDGDLRQVRLRGDVRLAFSGSDLIWLPQFLAAELEAPPLEAAHVQTDRSDWLGSVVQRANRDITDPVILLGKHTIALKPLPLGRIEAGAVISGSPDIHASGSQALGGVFTVAGSAILVDPGITSVALDLAFIPNISSCTADLQVSRSAFASGIQAREPVGVSRFLEAGDVRHFFTEVKGARVPTTVIHYWFADGLPVAVEELPVEPSQRWRTWSSKRIDRDDVRNWEVLVVEKSSGCILHTQAIRTESEGTVETGDWVESGSGAIDAFRSGFAGKVAGFSIMEEQPVVALLEVRRAFLMAVLRDSIRDASVTVSFDLAGQARRYEAGLGQFGADRFPCERRECSRQNGCEVLVSHCRRQYDTRDCTTCLFHNPLNNRCMNEAEDPICVAAKATQNATYEDRRQVCLKEEERERLQCISTRQQELRSCQLEAEAELGACESIHAAMGRLGPREQLARVFGEAEMNGIVQARFSDFQLGDDFKSLAMQMDFTSEAGLGGKIRFEPAPAFSPPGQCLSAWHSGFSVHLLAPPLPYYLLGAMSTLDAELVTDWPTLQLSATLGPSPLRALFTSRPGLLADCQMGLRTEDVEQALLGGHSVFFSGALDLQIQPLPSRILLAEASIGLGSGLVRARPRLGSGNLRYVLGE